VPGEITSDGGDIVLNEGRNTIEVRVTNRGDRRSRWAAITTSPKPIARWNSTALPARGAGWTSRRHRGAVRTGRNENGIAGRDCGRRIVRGGNPFCGGAVVSYRIPRRHYTDIYGPTTAIGFAWATRTWWRGGARSHRLRRRVQVRRR
jgi:hypothetical protein